MRRAWLVLLVLVPLAALPSSAAERRHGIGAGYDGSTVELDGEGSEDIQFVGFNVFAKFGLTDRWGLLVNYRDMDDNADLLFGEEDSYKQLGLHGVYMFRPDRQFRPHLKIGLSWIDIEARVLGRTFSDSAIAVSGGLGFEWGSQRLAFYLDFEFTSVSVELLPASKMDLLVGNTTLGAIYKF